jgi:hypothetical protein
VHVCYKETLKGEGRKREVSKQETKRHTQGAEPAQQADTEHSRGGKSRTGANTYRACCMPPVTSQVVQIILSKILSLRTFLATPAGEPYSAEEAQMWMRLKSSKFYENMHFCVAEGAPLPFRDWLRMLMQVPGGMRVRELTRIFDEEVRSPQSFGNACSCIALIDHPHVLTCSGSQGYDSTCMHVCFRIFR